jgi:hypothetical protein
VDFVTYIFVRNSPTPEKNAPLDLLLVAVCFQHGAKGLVVFWCGLFGFAGGMATRRTGRNWQVSSVHG